MIIKTIHRYIIKKFLVSFFIAIVLIILIAVVFDLSQHLNKFIDNKIPFKEIIFKYYINFIPYYTNLFASLFVFISVIFFTSKMAAKSEIIAMLASGISFWNLLIPYMISAFIIASISWYLGNYVIPPSNKKRIAFENKYFYHRGPLITRNIHKQSSPGVFLYIQYFDTRNNIAHTFSIEHFEGHKLVSKLFARYANWDSLKNKWVVYDYFIRKYGKFQDQLTYGHQLDTAVNIKPEDLKTINIDITTLTLPQLKKFIKREKLRGSENINAYMLEKYKRTSSPFSIFILTFLGFALSSKKTRSGTGLNLGIGIALSFTYIFFMQISDQFCLKGGMNPLIAVWIPNIIFAAIALLTYFIFAPK